MSTTLKTLWVALMGVSTLLNPTIVPPATYQINATEEIQKEVKLPEELGRACSCESSWEGTPTGTPQQSRTHRNKDGSVDYGACMVNSVHTTTAKNLKLDFVNSEIDNKKMALYIYKTQGIKAWYAYNPKTKDCVWNKQYK